MYVTLRPHQLEALENLSNGKILWGGVGSGKSITILAYYFEKELIGDIYAITTAKKRDSLEWQSDAAKFGIGREKGASVAGVLTVDSWNNIAKYEDVEGAFFIFDEQRLVGNGAWVKSFYKIAAKNAWVILSATPGDTWMDYVPVFVANGYYKNITEFKREHVVYRPFAKFPQIERYVNVPKLERLKKEVLVHMPYQSESVRTVQDFRVFHDVDLLKQAEEKRWNPYEKRPIKHASELFAVMRKIVYSDRSRLEALRHLMDTHPKIIVFYNFNYELDILRELNDSWSDLVEIGEWNGHKKEPLPTSDRWVYLVQYTSGSEGWNCTETDCVVFYSLTYSYKKYEQAQGRIDRMNSPFKKLYYYNLLSNSVVDVAVGRALAKKQDFNETKWVDDHMPIFSELDAKYDET